MKSISGSVCLKEVTVMYGLVRVLHTYFLTLIKSVVPEIHSVNNLLGAIPNNAVSIVDWFGVWCTKSQ